MYICYVKQRGNPLKINKMKTQFLIIGTFETDVINEVSLGSDGLTTKESFGVQTTEIIGGETFETELEAMQTLQNWEKENGFWNSWQFVEIKKVFVQS